MWVPKRHFMQIVSITCFSEKIEMGHTGQTLINLHCTCWYSRRNSDQRSVTPTFVAQRQHCDVIIIMGHCHSWQLVCAVRSCKNLVSTSVCYKIYQNLSSGLLTEVSSEVLYATDQRQICCRCCVYMVHAHIVATHKGSRSGLHRTS